MSARLAAVALTVAAALAVWTVLTPAAAIDGRGVLAVVIAFITLGLDAVPARKGPVR